MSSGSDGLYLSSLSNMSPATSDWGLISNYRFFPVISFVLDLSGPFYFSLIFHNMYPFGVVRFACDHGRRSRQLDQYGC